ncbi:MFS transporter [Erwiniaceae bacterium BAC15a-03b]|uniref:MFS transporter n=1 Tax=Winslowiella arboricola TaxID=2978220 RepID=A0A9J6PST9_9GAMM|nr:MFS transporter [Winslowiella arboricola]MCU5772598.1 MFS transporter [Winslowiella arboricola]MCU5778632.1 MFS transporter [Winslowiella arboricola]
MRNPTQTTAASGAFAPLTQGLFAVIWAATVMGNTGSFMRDVASSWLVTGLSSNPAAVALMQTAATLPIFLLAIPAGVLSDILDRRRLLISVQLLLASVSGTLLLLSHYNLLTVDYLIALTFIGGIGAALMGPAWQAIVPELVARPQLRNAVALNSLGINIARAIGPAAGGLLLAGLGAWAAYGADVLSYVFVIAALLWWKRPHKAQDALQEHFFGAFRAGLRYVRASRELHRVLLRAAIYFAFASGIWALLPLVARNLLQGDAGFYGMMLGAVGVGAIAGALLLARLRQLLSSDGLMLLSAVLSALVMVLLALTPPQWLALPLMVVLGVGWIIALTTLNGVAQAVLPDWVRGRGLAVWLMVFNGAMAGGSLFWGLVARQSGLVTTLLIAGAALLMSALLVWRLKLPAGDADLQPSGHWETPELEGDDRGPVMIQIHYQVAQEDRPAFLSAIRKLSLVRRRDGASAWGIAEHSAKSDTLVEWFLVESWHEHLRQHQRVSNADADLQREVVSFHRGDAKPVVHHLLSLH